jgi:uncharacterized protein involved in exopolysaccharide biosynthesis
MEEEVDLRQYIEVLIKHRWLIIAGTVLAALSAFVVTVLFRASYYAAMNQQAHRQALVALVENGAIATQIVERLEGELDAEEQNPARLLEMVSGEFRKTGTGSQAETNVDFIEIKVESSDPAKAARIANAWAQVYVDYVNELYSRRPESYTSVQKQVITAQETHEQAEEALTAFIAESRIDDLNRLIAEKQHIINSLQSARQTAVTTMIDEEVKARSQIIAAYVNAQTQNQLIAFEKEQEGNRALLSSYMDAYSREREAFFNEQVEDKLQTLANHYATKRKMERLLEDARALHVQVQKGGENGAATNSLAILMLKAEVFSTSTSLPGELQLQLEMASGINAGANAQQADLEALIGVLEDRITELEKMIESAGLLGGEGYEFLSSSTSLTDTLSAAIRDQYPELFDLGELTSLTEAIPRDNPLADAAAQKSEALLQLEELETLPGYAAAAAPLTQAIDKLQEELRGLQAELEKERAEKQELTRARDLAWETYSTLQVKADELSIATEMMDIEVRVASPAVEPITPTGPSKLRNVVLAAVVGFMIGIGAAFVLHYLDPEYDPSAVISALSALLRHR